MKRRFKAEIRSLNVVKYGGISSFKYFVDKNSLWNAQQYTHTKEKEWIIIKYKNMVKSFKDETQQNKPGIKDLIWLGPFI